jgi:hypothetical protein
MEFLDKLTNLVRPFSAVLLSPSSALSIYSLSCALLLAFAFLALGKNGDAAASGCGPSRARFSLAAFSFTARPSPISAISSSAF